MHLQMVFPSNLLQSTKHAQYVPFTPQILEPFSNSKQLKLYDHSLYDDGPYEEFYDGKLYLQDNYK